MGNNISPVAMADAEQILEREQDSSEHNGTPDDTEVNPEDTRDVKGEPPKKKRKVVKPNPGKKFECKHEGCRKA